MMIECRSRISPFEVIAPDVENMVLADCNLLGAKLKNKSKLRCQAQRLKLKRDEGLNAQHLGLEIQRAAVRVVLKCRC